MAALPHHHRPLRGLAKVLRLPGLLAAVIFALLLPAACSKGTQADDPASTARETVTGKKMRLDKDSPRIRNAPSRGLFWIDGPDGDVADLVLENMGTDGILGQVFLLGWQSELAEGPVMDWIRGSGLGGVKVFGWNGNSVSTLAATLSAMQSQALAGPLGIPLVVATDQEGGWVRHIKDTTSLTPGNLAIGATDLPYDAYWSSRYIAEELRLMGVNMNFAPTVDIYTEADAHVIGPRSYGSDGGKVSLLALAAYEGMEDARVISTAKHFPGHGNAVGDSHGTMLIINDSLSTIWDRDLLPYRDLIAHGLPAILVGHLAFPLIDGEKRPASLSHVLNHDLLREKLKYDGVVMTDDIFMGGATEYGGTRGWHLSDLVVEALRAGNDMVMLSRTPDPKGEVWVKLKKAYTEDEDFRRQVNDSARRIILMKLRYLKKADRVPLTPSPEAARNGIPSKEARNFFRQQTARAVTWMRGKAFGPEDLKGKNILIAGQDRDFLQSGQEFFPRARQFFFEYENFYNAKPSDLTALEAQVRTADQVIFCLANPNSKKILEGLKRWADRISVISTLTPVYLKDIPWVNRAVAVYGWDHTSFRYGFAALTGAYQPEGSPALRWFE